MPHRARDTALTPSLPGLTRQSILFERLLRSVMDTRVKPAYDAEYVAASYENFSIQISNSQAFSSSRRRASWAFSLSPLPEGRRNAERRALGNSAAACFPDCRETEATETPLSVPSRRLLRPWDRFFRARARASSPSRQVSPPFTRLVQPLKAAPRSGHGRLPKAPRVRRARPPCPQAPHPAPRYKRPGNAPLTGTG